MTACGKKQPVSENQILEDIKKYEEFAPLNVDVTDWEITKRQINYEDKTDFALSSLLCERYHYKVKTYRRDGYKENGNATKFSLASYTNLCYNILKALYFYYSKDNF